MWILTMIGILMGILEIRYAYLIKNKKEIRIKRVFMGLLTIMLSFTLLIIVKNNFP